MCDVFPNLCKCVYGTNLSYNLSNGESLMNPHRLPPSVSFWTSNPFEAMSLCAKGLGKGVARYYSGQYLPGMLICERSNTFFGYGILGDNGFIPINWVTQVPFKRQFN